MKDPNFERIAQWIDQRERTTDVTLELAAAIRELSETIRATALYAPQREDKAEVVKEDES